MYERPIGGQVEINFLQNGMWAFVWTESLSVEGVAYIDNSELSTA